MAFRATNILPVDALRRIKLLLVDCRRESVRLSTQLAAGTNSETILNSLVALGQIRAQLQTLATTPGLAVFARAQEDDVNYDIAAEYTGVVAAINAAGAALAAIIPKQSGYLLAYTLDSSGFQVSREFTPAECASAIPSVDALIAFIE